MSHAAPSAPASLAHDKRLDLQALRAIAVLLVIANHLFGKPTGGFIGVDVFFVLSGFLITDLLLREKERTGRISFLGFYRRRVKRIMPAAMLTLVVSVAAGFAILTVTRAWSMAWDAVSAALFVANWRFGLEGTNYLAEAGPTPALQHFWSLSVEEQFYFVWPVLLFVLYVLARGRDARHLAAIVLGLLAVGFFAFAVWETTTNPGMAYFSTLSRAWELAGGALLACLTPTIRRMPLAIRPFLAWAGLAGVFASAFFITSSTAFPGPWAAAPVLATMAVVAAGTGDGRSYLLPFTSRPVVYIGDISYSLYLWHFPPIVLLAVLMPTARRYDVLCLVIAFAAAVLSYHFVENPIRRSKWLVLRPHGGLLRVAASLAVVSITASVLLTVAAPAAPSSAQTDNKLSSSSSINGMKEHLQHSIAHSLSAKHWPKDLTPSLADAPDDSASEFNSTACFGPTKPDPKACTYGYSTATKSAMVVGDSIAMSWMPGIRSALEPEGYTVHGLGFKNCPLIDADIVYPARPDQVKACDASHSKVVAQVKKLKPDILVISDLEKGLGRLADGASGTKAEQEFEAARVRMIDELKPYVGRIVMLSSDPVTLDTVACGTAYSAPSACQATISKQWNQKEKVDSDAAQKTGITYVNTGHWFCSPGGRCPAFIDDIVVHFDAGHLTSTFSSYLAPLLRAELLPSTTVKNAKG